MIFLLSYLRRYDVLYSKCKNVRLAKETLISNPW